MAYFSFTYGKIRKTGNFQPSGCNRRLVLPKVRMFYETRNGKRNSEIVLCRNVDDKYCIVSIFPDVSMPR